MDKLIERISLLSSTYLVAGFLFVVAQLCLFIDFYFWIGKLSVQDAFFYLLIILLLLVSFFSGTLLDITYDIFDTICRSVSKFFPKKLTNFFSIILDIPEVIIETQADLMVSRVQKTQLGKDLESLLDNKINSKSARSLAFEGKRYARIIAQSSNSHYLGEEEKFFNRLIFLKIIIADWLLTVLEIIILKTYKYGYENWIVILFLFYLIPLIRAKHQAEAAIENDALLNATIQLYKEQKEPQKP